MIDFIPISELAPLVLAAAGLAIVVTCTRIAYPLRFAWCAVFQARWTRWLWKVVLCPHCCSWWTGFGLGLATSGDWIHALQVGFTTCGLVYILQRALARGYGVAIDTSEKGQWRASIESVNFEPPEDFEEILELKE